MSYLPQSLSLQAPATLFLVLIALRACHTDAPDPLQHANLAAAAQQAAVSSKAAADSANLAAEQVSRQSADPTHMVTLKTDHPQPLAATHSTDKSTHPVDESSDGTSTGPGQPVHVHEHVQPAQPHDPRSHDPTSHEPIVSDILAVTTPDIEPKPTEADPAAANMDTAEVLESDVDRRDGTGASILGADLTEPSKTSGDDPADRVQSDPPLSTINARDATGLEKPLLDVALTTSTDPAASSGSETRSALEDESLGSETLEPRETATLPGQENQASGTDADAMPHVVPSVEVGAAAEQLPATGVDIQQDPGILPDGTFPFSCALLSSHEAMHFFLRKGTCCCSNQLLG